MGLPADHQESAPPAETRWIAETRRHFAAAIHQGALHPVLLPYFAANIAIQLMIQPILHYWQPYFQALSPTVDPARQGVIFAAYCGTSAAFGLWYARRSKTAWARSRWTTVLLFFLFSCLYLGLSAANGWVTALVLFCLLQGVLSLARTSLSVRMNEVVDSKSRASILSALSLTSRFGMIAALALIARLAGKGEASAPDAVLALYRVFGSLSFAICLLPLAAIVVAKFRAEPAR
jgi:hypothetical protein